MTLFEQITGALVVLLILLDVFLTVLYARMGSGIISQHLARRVWLCFRALARRVPLHDRQVLSFCGPIILVLLVVVWTGGLALGSALIIHPVLGTAVQSSGGKSPTDFISALYAGATSISIVGASDFYPRTPSFRLLYVFNSIAGMSVTTLTLTYLMQIYSELQQRNTFALKIYLATRRTGDAAELIAGIGPHGEWSSGTSMLWEVAAEVAAMKEAHHFYPVLFYMRFAEHYYSISFVTLVLLDSITIMRAGLTDEALVITQLGALDQIWEGSILLLTTLEETFLSQGSPHPKPPDAEEERRWEARFNRAGIRLSEAGIPTRVNQPEAFAAYRALRTQWNIYIDQLAPSMMYPMKEIDVAMNR
jgi:hypothetical protein